MKTIRTAFLAATAALLVMPAVQAGGLGGALGGTVGGALGAGSFGGGSFGGAGNAAGNGEGRFGAPDLGRPIGRLHDAGDAASTRGTNAAAKTRDRAANTRASADGTANGAVSGVVNGAQASAQQTQSNATPASAPTSAPASEPSKGLSADGLIGGSAGAETPKHEARVEGAGMGAARADRSGADASVSPTASAHAGRKAPPAATPSDSTGQ